MKHIDVPIIRDNLVCLRGETIFGADLMESLKGIIRDINPLDQVLLEWIP